MQGNIDFTGSLTGSIAGGGGGGSNVTITPTLESGTKIADYTIDSDSGSLYAPTPQGLTAELPLDISDNVISIDLSDYVTETDLNTVLDDYTTYQYTESRYTPLATFNSYTISAESHFQRTLTAGTNITIDPVTNTISASGGGGINYSTTEQDTGVLWLDGSKIYQKTFKIENIAVSGNMSRFYTLSDYISNISVPIKVEFLLKNNSTNVYYVMPYTLTGSIVTSSGCCVLAGNELILNTGSSFASFTGTLICTLKYTKNTV